MIELNGFGTMKPTREDYIGFILWLVFCLIFGVTVTYYLI